MAAPDSCAGSVSEIMQMRISIIIPVLNDAVALALLLKQLPAEAFDVIVVDGGSKSLPESITAEAGAQLIVSKPGRALQQNAGADAAKGDVLWFLHADSGVPVDARAQIQHAIDQGSRWGRFDVRLSGGHPMFRVIEWMMNQRSHLTGICTGDQGIFVRRELFCEIGGFADMPLMEDIEFSKRLKQRNISPCRVRSRLKTSSRRWQENGIVRTILLMWSLRLRYFLGASPQTLVARYYVKKHG
jgi:rSAM/selenodomain-associated transferase 2